MFEAGRQFDEKLRAMLGERGYSVVSDYTDYIWSGRFFYDSDYHLNDLGAIYRTEQLLADMRDAGLIDVEI